MRFVTRLLATARELWPYYLAITICSVLGPRGRRRTCQPLPDQGGQGAVRQRVGVVFQDPSLFSGTIRENIAYGDPSRADEHAIEEAARRDRPRAAQGRARRQRRHLSELLALQASASKADRRRLAMYDIAG